MVGNPGSESNRTPAGVQVATAFLAGSPVTAAHVFQGNAPDSNSYGHENYHFIASTGLGEFLNDDDLGRLYAAILRALAPGGTFFTSATAFDKRSDAILLAFELNEWSGWRDSNPRPRRPERSSLLGCDFC